MTSPTCTTRNKRKSLDQLVREDCMDTQTMQARYTSSHLIHETVKPSQVEQARRDIERKVDTPIMSPISSPIYSPMSDSYHGSPISLLYSPVSPIGHPNGLSPAFDFVPPPKQYPVRYSPIHYSLPSPSCASPNDDADSYDPTSPQFAPASPMYVESASTSYPVGLGSSPVICSNAIPCSPMTPDMGRRISRRYDTHVKEHLANWREGKAGNCTPLPSVNDYDRKLNERRIRSASLNFWLIMDRGEHLFKIVHGEKLGMQIPSRF